MLNLTYLAVLEPGENGSYGISFPDLPGCFSFCDSLSEAGAMATEAAELHVYNLMQDGEDVPEPSASLSFTLDAGVLMMPITIHPDLYRLKRDNERVKTNVTLPAWLKQLGEASGVNYSKLLEAALLEYLGLPKAKGSNAQG